MKCHERKKGFLSIFVNNVIHIMLCFVLESLPNKKAHARTRSHEIINNQLCTISNYANTDKKLWLLTYKETLKMRQTTGIWIKRLLNEAS